MKRALVLVVALGALGGCVVDQPGGYYPGGPYPHAARPAPVWGTGPRPPPPEPRYIPGPWGPQVGTGYTRPGYAQQSPYPFGHFTRQRDPAETMSTGN